MNLYVWEGVLTDYTSGIMFALAESVEQAREVLCPGWNEAERRLKDGSAVSSQRPMGPQPDVNNGHGYCVGSVHEDLRGDPDIWDPLEPRGLVIWGGG